MTGVSQIGSRADLELESWTLKSAIAVLAQRFLVQRNRNLFVLAQQDDQWASRRLGRLVCCGRMRRAPQRHALDNFSQTRLGNRSSPAGSGRLLHYTSTLGALSDGDDWVVSDFSAARPRRARRLCHELGG